MLKFFLWLLYYYCESVQFPLWVELGSLPLGVLGYCLQNTTEKVYKLFVGKLPDLFTSFPQNDAFSFML